MYVHTSVLTGVCIYFYLSTQKLRAEILALLRLPSGCQSYNYGHLTPSGSIYRQQPVITERYQSTYVSVGIAYSTFSDKRYR